jgi:hypothetical protein
VFMQAPFVSYLHIPYIVVEDRLDQMPTTSSNFATKKQTQIRKQNRAGPN